MYTKNSFFIGGEFETKKIYKKKNFKLFIKGSFFLSGRSALNNLIFSLNKKYENIYVPHYSCQSITSVLKSTGLNLFYYDIDSEFRPLIKNEKGNSIILLIDYFGKKNKFKSKKKNCIVRDISHSWIDYINHPENKQVLFCSLRKLGIFNLGGWHNYSHSIGDNDASSDVIKKINNNYILLRKKKYSFLKQKKNFLKKQQLYILKKIILLEKKFNFLKLKIKKKYLLFITKKHISDIKKCRINNYMFLKKNIIKDKFTLNYLYNETPLFFLLKFKNSQKRNYVRKKLIESNIFCPIHWKVRNNKTNNFVDKFSSKVLSIPIDQRYNRFHMKHVTQVLSTIQNSYDS